MERNHSVDTLRTISTLLVIVIHVVADYVITGMENNIYDTAFWIGNTLDSFSRICVPIFVLISGRFLIGKDETFKESYKKRASRILIPLLGWTIIFIVFKAVLDYKEDQIINISNLLISIFLGKPYYHMWYLYMLIGLYLITPVLNIILPKISRKNLWRVSLFLVFFGIVNSFYNLTLSNSPIFLLWFVDYLGYFLLGYLLQDSEKRHSSIFLFMLYIILGIIISLLTFYTAKNFGNLYFHHYLSPFVIISALAIYKLFDQINIRENLFSRYSHLTFGIYLIHAGILAILDLQLKHLNFYPFDFTILTIFIKFSLTLIISTIIVSLLWKIKFLRKII